MREESHLDEMRSAIRRDFERLAERRGEQELMRVDTHTEPNHDASPEAVLEGVLEPEGAQGQDHEPQRSWLARFLSP